MNATTTLLAAAAAAAILAVSSAEAQQQRPAQDAPPPPDSTILVFEREVFQYPTFARRNPFRPLSSVSETGPRFDRLQLLGVISHADPDLSVALLGLSTAGGARQAGAPTYRVRVGEVLGNARVLEIRRMEVIFEVEEFGVRDRRALEVLKPNEFPQEPDTVPEQVPEAEDVPAEPAPTPDPGGSI